MTTSNDVPSALRPVLEALRDAAGWMRMEVQCEEDARRTAQKQHVAWLDLEARCARALASDAGTQEGEPEYRCLRCQGPIPEDALRMGEFNHCSERCAAPLAESGAAAPPTTAPETSTSLVDAAPDAELDRLLIEYARCQVQARYASLPQSDINRLAYAVEYAAAAIHAHVERVKREARGEVIGTALIKPRWEHGDEYTPHICMGDWRRNGGTEPFYVDLVRRREKEEG